jgi:phosphate transport system substrate-binding protein
MLQKSRWAWLVALLAVFSLFAAACGDDEDEGGAGDGGSSGEIVISGSSTVEPISSAVAEAFKADNPDIGIEVNGPGTGDGFELFCSGETDISDASRPIKEEEATACEEAGIEYIELAIGIDGITVLTNPANDTVECLDFGALYALLGPEATAGTWAEANELAEEVGSAYTDLPDASLDVTAPGEESGTYDSFVEIVFADLAEDRGQEEVSRPDYTASPNDNVIIEGIAGSESSLGWVGFSFYENNADTVRAIPIAGEDGTCVEPTSETIASGEYPISRTLYIYVNTSKAAENEALTSFVDSYLSEVGYEAVADTGYVQLTEDAWAETVAAWGELTGGSTTDTTGATGDTTDTSAAETTETSAG